MQSTAPQSPAPKSPQLGAALRASLPRGFPAEMQGFCKTRAIGKKLGKLESGEDAVQSVDRPWRVFMCLFSLLPCKNCFSLTPEFLQVIAVRGICFLPGTGRVGGFPCVGSVPPPEPCLMAALFLAQRQAGRKWQQLPLARGQLLILAQVMGSHSCFTAALARERRSLSGSSYCPSRALGDSVLHILILF